MARLNTNLPSSSQPSRATTVDSLYKDPTPRASSRPIAPVTSSARQSSYSVMSPSASVGSDKENQVPESRENTPRPITKSRQAMAAGAARLPTPNSGSSHSSGRSKRRRTDDYTIVDSTPVFEDGDESVAVHQDEDEFDDATHVNGAEDEDTKYYDPQQDPDLRRQIRANIRQHHREIEDNRDELIKPGNNLLLQHLKRQDYYMNKVRQTADAALDSRVMVLASDLAGKKLNNSLHGNNGVGIDVDQFVSKCIFFMKSGGNPVDSDDEAVSSTQPRSRRRTAFEEEDEDEEEIGDGLDWAVLGREACFPSSKRPPVSSFLLGPLSVQKRVRASQGRRARSQRQPVGPATRPQELTSSDIKQSENSNLTHLVTGIKSRLEEHINIGGEKVEAELTEFGDDVDDEDVRAACRRYRVYQTPEQEAAASLFDFVINPKSFGQTVENMFYVSFLIREGNVKVLHDENGLPLLVPSKPHSIEEQRERHIQKHQAVFSLDWPTWKSLIDAFDIKDPLIPHRIAEETNVSAGGWYG